MSMLDLKETNTFNEYTRL